MNRTTPWTKFRAWLASSKTLWIAILVALVFRFSIAAPYKIPTGSMIPTLKIGDFIFVSKLSYGLKLPLPFTNIDLVTYGQPKRGDVIVFEYPKEPEKDYIKRVVAVGGDTLEVRDGILYVNGEAKERVPLPDKGILSDQPPKVRDTARLYRERLDTADHIVMETFPIPLPFGPKEVPDGTVFVMGDNRDNSADSRFWGSLPLGNVRGRALFVWLSIDTDNPYLSIAGHAVLPRIRWERFGMKVR